MKGVAHLELEAGRVSVQPRFRGSAPPGPPPPSLSLCWACPASLPSLLSPRGIVLTRRGGDSGAPPVPPAQVQELVVEEDARAR